MELFEVISIGVIASVLFLLIKDKQPTIAFLVVLFTVIYFFLFIMQYVQEILRLIAYLGERANINSVYIKTILQIIGISYITEIGANIVRDAGLKSVAVKIEMVGKVFILILAIPIFQSLIETIINIFPIT
ncbi:stage III sporulation protein AD [Gracilibacillus sp. S3-1-1]|uniref:Stage III sporulation protein AD n=1 Tax=Gracilibacillus pellucidus TaxID=3095368 RepID=A0ACC6M4Y6_9BACI|nr:stage III sporulation protein AD [Gracilibacillus sp. S3-1-1]MDX8046020.1 stage III sporulation protein AD [Gracilibacillus sp. S3-1-1]